MPLERRQHPRITISVEVDFKSGGNFYAASTGDISSGGLFLTKPSVPLEIGSAVALRLRLLNKSFAMTAEVVWELRDEEGALAGVGMRFLDLSQPAERTIRTFMALRAPMLFEEIRDAEEA
jgi:uncharacterized protein (TIGR02266 family)